MDGLIIWAPCGCRSVMATYRALFVALGVPGLVTFMRTSKTRAKTGFRADEFRDVDTVYVGKNYDLGVRIIHDHPGWAHVFCEYQNDVVCRRLLHEAKSTGARVAVFSEAPCNMSSGFKRLMKDVYLKTVVPIKVRSVVREAEFFVNFSGNDRSELKIGWKNEKVIPFGYFPPPIEGSHCVLRRSNKPFVILSTGILSRHRGADILLDALRILKGWRVNYRAIITQGGELFDELVCKAESLKLPVAFPGLVSLPEVIKLYETCSVYVGAGRNEPWGMRLNDALNCGAPLLVSRGMGGVKLVDDYGCGLSFKNEDALDLACQLKRMATDEKMYLDCASRVVLAAKECQPEIQAKRLADLLKQRGWDFEAK